MGAREVPLGITMSTGTLAVVVCCAVPSIVTGPGVDARLGVLAVGLAAFAASVVDLAAVAISVGVGFLLFDGFVEGDHGDLVWRGRADLVRFGVLCLAGALGLLLGVLRRRRERRHAALSIPDASGLDASGLDASVPHAAAPDAPAVEAGELQALPLMPRQRFPQPAGSPRSPEAAGE
ncbi:MAG: hypothetical protein ACXV3S_07185 [Kineosporiaceae bacterium]